MARRALQGEYGATGAGFPFIKGVPDDLELHFQETPRLNGPYGAAGCGEGPLTSPHAAIINAIYNACGARVTHLPACPEKVLKALEGEEGSAPKRPGASTEDPRTREEADRRAGYPSERTFPKKTFAYLSDFDIPREGTAQKSLYHTINYYICNKKGIIDHGAGRASILVMTRGMGSGTDGQRRVPDRINLSFSDNPCFHPLALWEAQLPEGFLRL